MPIATAFAPAPLRGTSHATYRPSTTAMAATIPECMLQNMAQPQRNPAAGEYASLRKTYTPPLRGYAEASSAATSAPINVRPPASAHAA